MLGKGWDGGRSLRSRKSLARDERIALEEKLAWLKRQDELVAQRIKTTLQLITLVLAT